MPIDHNATIVRSASLEETTVGREVVLMSLDAGECLGLGETGSAVWHLLKQPTRIEPVVATLSRQYDAPPEVIEQDVRDLLDDMLRRGLIEVV